VLSFPQRHCRIPECKKFVKKEPAQFSCPENPDDFVTVSSDTGPKLKCTLSESEEQINRFTTVFSGGKNLPAALFFFIDAAVFTAAFKMRININFPLKLTQVATYGKIQ